MSRQLPIHEWVAVFIFIAILATVGAVSHIRRAPDLPAMETQITVRVSGEVEKPGYHHMLPGSTLKDLYPHIRPKPDSIPVGHSEDESLQDGQRIHFKSSLVNVRIQGAVRTSQTLKLKLGIQLSEAKELIDLAPDADFSKVQHRMIKRNRQVVTIPRRKD